MHIHLHAYFLKYVIWYTILIKRLFSSCLNVKSLYDQSHNGWRPEEVNHTKRVVIPVLGAARGAGLHLQAASFPTCFSECPPHSPPTRVGDICLAALWPRVSDTLLQLTSMRRASGLSHFWDYSSEHCPTFQVPFVDRLFLCFR